MKVDTKKFKGLCAFKKDSAKVVKIVDSDFVLSGRVEQTSKNYYKVSLLLKSYSVVQQHARSLSEAEQIIYNQITAQKRKDEQANASKDILPGQLEIKIGGAR